MEMPFLRTYIIALLPLLMWCGLARATETGVRYEMLRAGEVMPDGWMLEQMRLDLQEGITGNYEKISDNVNGQLFVRQDRRPNTEVIGNRGRKEIAWWAGEHEGYWKDAVIRMAFLTDDKDFQAKAHAWIDAILEAQGDDGYIGIYTEEGRFPKAGPDGELWTQSRIFQGMLAYHEFTGDARVLDAVARAVRLTLAAYQDSTYFQRPGADGGVGHGVGFMDSLEWLYRLTGEDIYKQGAIWLYEDLSRAPVFKVEDLTLDNLLDRNSPWQTHTPHILEGLHMPQILHALTGDARYGTAADNALEKLAWHTNPGGGFVGDEHVNGRYGAGNMPSEYCSKAEAIPTLNRIVAYRGDLAIGDRIEATCLNAAQGARFHPANTAVVYLSYDNTLRADNPRVHQGRKIFSASHIAAACCPLNAGRLMPYYVEGMWYRDDARGALIANLFGASTLKTRIQGTDVSITQETNYPFSDEMVFRVHPGQPLTFTLMLRKPEGSGDVVVVCDGAEITQESGEIQIRKEWRSGDAATVKFGFEVQLRPQWDQQEFYYQWGPLVFALPLGEQTEKIQELTTVSGIDSGYFDYAMTPLHEARWEYRIQPDAVFELIQHEDGDVNRPWSHPPIALAGRMIDPDGNAIEVKLTPLGSSHLRRTTFPLHVDE